MSALSDYLEGEIVKHLFRTGSFTKPTVLAISLHTADPTDVTATAAGNECPNSDGYARVTANPLDATWDAVGAGGTDGHTSNTGVITFAAPTGDGWGVVTHFAIWDNATYGAGNMLIHGQLTAPKTINGGDPAPTFPAGALDVTFA